MKLKYLAAAAATILWTQGAKAQDTTIGSKYYFTQIQTAQVILATWIVCEENFRGKNDIDEQIKVAAALSAPFSKRWGVSLIDPNNRSDFYRAKSYMLGEFKKLDRVKKAELCNNADRSVNERLDEYAKEYRMEIE